MLMNRIVSVLCISITWALGSPTLVCLMLRKRRCGVEVGSAASVTSVTAVLLRLSCERLAGAECR